MGFDREDSPSYTNFLWTKIFKIQQHPSLSNQVISRIILFLPVICVFWIWKWYIALNKISSVIFFRHSPNETTAGCYVTVVLVVINCYMLNEWHDVAYMMEDLIYISWKRTKIKIMDEYIRISQTCLKLCVYFQMHVLISSLRPLLDKMTMMSDKQGCHMQSKLIPTLLLSRKVWA